MNSNGGSASLSFPKSRRLNHTAEFVKVRREGRARHGELLTLAVLQTDPADPARWGFITSKRVGGAVVRNRVRRRLREIVRLHQNELRTGRWIVIIARAAASAAKYDALEAEWLRLARAAQLLDETP